MPENYQNIVSYVSDKLKCDDNMSHHYALICRTNSIKKQYFERDRLRNQQR